MSKLSVLDHGFVELIDHMGSDLTVVNAARVSFGKRKTEFDPTDRKLIRYLLKHGHTSPLRHCQLQFHVKAPIFVLRQWMRHRIASEFNEVSSRYVELGAAEFYHPEKFREQSTSNKQGSAGDLTTGVTQAHDSYDNAISQAQRSYTELRSLGVAKEQARCVMPVSQYSEVYWTASLQAVLHFLSLRLDSHAQWEIREYAKAVRELILAIFPVVVSEYEAIRDRSEADAKLAMCAVRLALADVAFEGNPTPENIATLDSLRGELRSLFADYAHCYTDEQ